MLKNCGTKAPQQRKLTTEPAESEGLEFTEITNGYQVVGLGTCTDQEIIIPNTYNGLPVTSIGDQAFEKCTSFTSITYEGTVAQWEAKYVLFRAPVTEVICSDGTVNLSK